MLFYEELKQSREKLGLTVEQISNRTKISKEIISGIESGKWSILPKTYLRLFLKAYAQEVNLDPQVILQNFEMLTNPEEPLPPSRPSASPNIPFEENLENHEDHNNPDFRKKPNRNFATAIIILVITIFMISILKQVISERKEKNTIAAFPTPPASDTSQAVIPPDTQTVKPNTDLNLTILTKDSCWIRITVDNRDSFEANLPPHYRKEAIAKERFDVRVGRPASINLILNGKDLGPVGAPAIPTRLIITKEGIIRRQSFITH